MRTDQQDQGEVGLSADGFIQRQNCVELSNEVAPKLEEAEKAEKQCWQQI